MQAQTDRPWRAGPAQAMADCGGECRGGCGLGEFDASGGAATGGDVAARLRSGTDQPVSMLARWIVDRQVVSFACRAGLMLPAFQFDFDRCQVRNGVAAAASELSAGLNDKDVALWFVQDNAWLRDATPAAVLLSDAASVVNAARADRFARRG